jgi:hypothetical protein
MFYDLHTHLMGMGNKEFWVDQIICKYLPQRFKNMSKEDSIEFYDKKPSLFKSTRESFDKTKITNLDEFLKERLQQQYKEQIEWNEKSVNEEFVNKEYVMKEKEKEKKKQEDIKKKQKDIDKINFNELFTHDIVYPIKDLIEIIVERYKDQKQIDKLNEYELACRLGADDEWGKQCKEYIIWNARKQLAEFVVGITNTYLVSLIQENKKDKEDKDLKKKKQAARSIIENCFSMLSRDGNDPNNVDLHIFRGHFTPEFYPNRYLLKDFIYQQDLNVLDILMCYTLDRYAKSNIKYIEYSIGFNDSFKFPWVFKHIADPTPKDFEKFFDFDISVRSKVVFKFLCGIPRTSIPSPAEFEDETLKIVCAIPTNGNSMHEWLSKEKTIAVHSKYQELICNEAFHSTNFPWNSLAQQMQMIKDAKIRDLSNEDFKKSLGSKIVGFDWLSDEYGVPFCAFLHPIFKQFYKVIKEKNPKFGFRYHSGESIPTGHLDTWSSLSEYFTRLRNGFTNHMEISCEVVKQMKGNYDCIRIGHGVGYFFGDGENKILKEFKENYTTIEVNYSSNLYLLHKVHISKRHYIDLMLTEGINVLLCTDNDGIWDIKQKRGNYSVRSEFDSIKREQNIDQEKQEKLIEHQNNFRDYIFARLDENEEKLLDENEEKLKPQENNNRSSWAVGIVVVLGIISLFYYSKKK